jgi:DNA-binding CsgD family transcriptional regulator
MMTAPKDILVAPSARAAWQVGAANDTGSMMAFATDQGPRSHAHSSIPAVVVSGDRRLIHVGMEHQLSIPYRLEETMFRTYIVARGGKDYSDDDLMLARHIQQSLITVDQQICVLAHLSAEHGVAAAAADFRPTGREMAVLRLLTEGRTTRASARRLGCAPRTVEKHLERCFRKLGVRDRLNAVRMATQAGLVTHSQAQGMGHMVGRSAP